MSKSLGRTLYQLQPCEHIAARRCASLTSRIFSHDPTPTPPKRLRQQRRPFSASSPWDASQIGRAIKPSARKQRAPSMAVQMAQQRDKAMREGVMPDDIGLLPNTFVMPRGANRPSLTGDFRGRLLMERTRFVTRLQEAISAFVYRFWFVRPTPRLHLFRIPGIAKEMHKNMYANFAAGNLAPMEGQICAGLLGSLRARITQRPPNTSLRWTLHKHLSSPRLVSYKAALVPSMKNDKSGEKNGFVQAIVRIHSLQSLQHVKKVSTREVRNQLATKEVLVDAQGRELPAEEQQGGTGVPKNAKESVEYFVLQKSLTRSKEGPWKVWGTAEEMTLDKLRREMRKTQQGLLAKSGS